MRQDAVVSLSTSLRSAKDSLNCTPITSFSCRVGKIEFIPVKYIRQDNTLNKELLVSDLKKSGCNYVNMDQLVAIFDKYLTNVLVNQMDSRQAMTNAIRTAKTNDKLILSDKTLPILSKVDVTMNSVLSSAPLLMRKGDKDKDKDKERREKLNNALSDCAEDRDRSMLYLDLGTAITSIGVAIGGASTLGAGFGAFACVIEGYSVSTLGIKSAYNDCVKRAYRDYGDKKN